MDHHVMTVRDRLDVQRQEWRRGAALAKLNSLSALTITFMETACRYYRAAILYESLSGLSDAELMRRGLDRATLAQDICESIADDREL
ncbi:MAG TPA: hypothetical protein VG900_08110 [Hyphomicrobiaceae bacterium]|jgi:hypothetical protein|nr:hypothetical protein [Hyphomicrobiaceae bacterium]